MSTYSNRIRELRKNKSLSQEQLADKLGVTKQAVSQMERGARKPSVTMLEALCDFFNVSTDYYFYSTVGELHKIKKPRKMQNSC